MFEVESGGGRWYTKRKPHTAEVCVTTRSRTILIKIVGNRTFIGTKVPSAPDLTARSSGHAGEFGFRRSHCYRTEKALSAPMNGRINGRNGVFRNSTRCGPYSTMLDIWRVVEQSRLRAPTESPVEY